MKQSKHTVHWPVVVIAVRVLAQRASHPMRVQAILPVADLHDFLVTVSVFLVVVWSRRIINVVPVLNNVRFTVLLAFLPATTLSFLALVSVVIIFQGRPISQGALR